LDELEAEMKANHRINMEKELGDFIFSIINAARLYELDPESALERTNQKFIGRFNYLEEQTLLKGRSLHDMSLAEMDLYWNEAKLLEKDTPIKSNRLPFG
jgi:Protein containing tetrapyrrole methyltransferase domain and MazG-like (predicted pyrophosphatase) domain